LSHDHDIPHEPIFLGIGASSSADAGNINVEEGYVVGDLTISGSPEGADFDIFYNAYHEKLQKIHSTTGEDTVTYLTRRVEQQRSGEGAANPTNSTEKKTALGMNFITAVKGLMNKDNLEGQLTDSDHDVAL